MSKKTRFPSSPKKRRPSRRQPASRRSGRRAPAPPPVPSESRRSDSPRSGCRGFDAGRHRRRRIGRRARGVFRAAAAPARARGGPDRVRAAPLAAARERAGVVAGGAHDAPGGAGDRRHAGCGRARLRDPAERPDGSARRRVSARPAAARPRALCTGRSLLPVARGLGAQPCRRHRSLGHRVGRRGRPARDQVGRGHHARAGTRHRQVRRHAARGDGHRHGGPGALAARDRRTPGPDPVAPLHGRRRDRAWAAVAGRQAARRDVHAAAAVERHRLPRVQAGHHPAPAPPPHGAQPDDRRGRLPPAPAPAGRRDPVALAGPADPRDAIFPRSRVVRRAGPRPAAAHRGSARRSPDPRVGARLRHRRRGL